MSQIDDDEVLLALRGILLAVPGLPADRVYDNAFVVVGGQKVAYQPKPGVSYVSEQFMPNVSALQTNNGKGLIVDTGLYFVTWFGITGEGGKAIRAGTTAIKTAFASRSVVMPSGNILRVLAAPGPVAGQIIPLAEGGHSYSQVTIGWEVQWNQPS